MDVDLTQITGLLGSIGTVIKLAGSAKNMEMVNAALELQQKVNDVQMGMSSLIEENRELKAKLSESQRLREIEADLDMQTDGHFYVRKSEAGRGLIPYCPVCWGKDTKLVPLAPHKHPGVYRCALHESLYWTKVYEEWQAKQPKDRRVNRSGWLDR